MAEPHCGDGTEPTLGMEVEGHGLRSGLLYEMGQRRHPGCGGGYLRTSPRLHGVRFSCTT